MAYVKVCPVCGYANPEDSIPEDLCRGQGAEGPCNNFLAFVALTSQEQRPATAGAELPAARPPMHEDVPTETPPFPLHRPGATPDRSGQGASQPGMTERYIATPVCYLSLAGGGRDFPVIAEGICGRLDPGVVNQIALDGIPGLNVIHSRHCQFSCREGVWYVTAIDNAPGKGYTNPTYVNNVMIRPGETRAIRHGDSLTLSGTTFTFRVVAP